MAERPQCGRAAKRVKAPRTSVSRVLKECHENSRNFRAARMGANGASERSEGTGGRRQASRLRLSLAFGARKNARSSPPSAKKNGYRSFWSRRASAQPTAGRPLAGRPEAEGALEEEVVDGLLQAVWRSTERQAGNALSGERSNRGEENLASHLHRTPIGAGL